MPESRLGHRAGDFLIHIESEQRCLISGQLTAPATPPFLSLTDGNVTAYPLLVNNVLAKAADAASVVAFVIWGRAVNDLAAGTDTDAVPEYTILNDFTGAVLNEDAIPANDMEGNPFTIATIVTAIEALGAKFVQEPVKTTILTN